MITYVTLLHLYHQLGLINGRSDRKQDPPTLQILPLRNNHPQYQVDIIPDTVPGKLTDEWIWGNRYKNSYLGLAEWLKW
jgi:hypothetical protein